MKAFGQPEPEVTVAMVKAGIKAYCEAEGLTYVLPRDERTVAAIYRAMAQAYDDELIRLEPQRSAAIRYPKS